MTFRLQEDNFDRFEAEILETTKVIQRRKAKELQRLMKKNSRVDTGLQRSLVETWEAPDHLADTGLDVLVGVRDERRRDVAYFNEVGTSRTRGDRWLTRSLNELARSEG